MPSSVSRPKRLAGGGRSAPTLGIRIQARASPTIRQEELQLIRITLAFTALLLSACATAPHPTDQSEPTRDVLDQAATQPKENTGRVFIKRDSGFVGAACAIMVSVNAKPLASLRQGQVVAAYLPPGEYILGANSTGICGGGDAESPLTLKVGETRTYRISIDQGGSIRLGPTAQ